MIYFSIAASAALTARQQQQRATASPRARTATATLTSTHSPSSLLTPTMTQQHSTGRQVNINNSIIFLILKISKFSGSLLIYWCQSQEDIVVILNDGYTTGILVLLATDGSTSGILVLLACWHYWHYYPADYYYWQF